MHKHHDVLVLNRGFAPVHVIDWEKTMTLIIKEHARPLDRDFSAYTFTDWLNFSCSNVAEDYDKIKTTSRHIAIPEIISLSHYNRLPDREVKFSRQSVFTRDNNTCQYCEKVFPNRKELTIDHVVPRSKGGKTFWDNIVCCCSDCNARKADRTIAEVKERYPQDGDRWDLAHKPRKPKWENPVQNRNRVHICRSWAHFMNRIATDE